MQINELRKLIQEVKLQEALQRGIQQVVHPFKAVFIFGPAGSGKTTMKEHLGVPDYFVSVNTDELVESVFPRFGLSLDYTEGDQHVKQELRKLLQQATANKAKAQINKCKPLLFDTPGDKPAKIRKIVRALVAIGYDVALFQINVPPDYSIVSDQVRGEKGKRTLGREKTREIANRYQIQIVRGGAYLQLGQERGVTLLADKVYPNLFDLRDGSLRPDFDPSTLQDDELELKDPIEGRPSKYMRNPFLHASWDAAKDILDTAQENLTQWLSAPLPENPTGRVLYDALEYIQDQGVGTLGDQITDIAQYGAEHIKNPEQYPITSAVDEALYLTIGVRTKIEKAVPPEKYPETDPKYSPLQIKYKGPAYTKKGAPVAKDITQSLSLEELKDFITLFNKKNST